MDVMDFFHEVLSLVDKEMASIRDQIPKLPIEKDRYEYLVTLTKSEKLEVREAARRVLVEQGPEFGKEPSGFHF